MVVGGRDDGLEPKGWGGGKAGGGGGGGGKAGGGGGGGGGGIATGLGRKPVGGCYSAGMRRPAIRSTVHDPIQAVILVGIMDLNVNCDYWEF